MGNRTPIFAAVALLAGSPWAGADESLWIYTKGAETLPQGEFEAKLLTVHRLGKESGDYMFNDIRPMVEWGLTDRLTLEFQWQLFHHDYSVNDPDLQPMFDSQGGAGASFDDTQFAGWEVLAKYNILSPYKDFMGLSLGFGFERRNVYRLDGAEIDQDSFFPVLYLQKNFLDDTVVVAMSTKMEMERRESGEVGDRVLEEEIAFDIGVGVSYRFAPNWNIGLEFRHQSDYLCPEFEGELDPYCSGGPSSFDLPEIQLGDNFQNGNYIGPTIHFAQRHWWATAGVLFQFYGAGSGNSYVRDGLNLDEHERVHVGFHLGYEF